MPPATLILHRKGVFDDGAVSELRLWVVSTQVRGSKHKSYSMTELRITVGGNLAEDGAAFLDAWRQAERGVAAASRVLSFESWEGLSSVLTGERYRLLRHVHAHPADTVSALARSLNRQYRRVHADVAALEQAGLLDRSEGQVRATADNIHAEIRL